MRISVDEAKCCGAGQCVLVAPAVFDQRPEDGVVVLLTSEPPIGEHGNVHEAVETCPAGVITVQDQEGT